MRFLIIDRDTKYTPRFRELVEKGATEVRRLPPVSPDLNPCVERFVRSIQGQCPGKTIFIGQASLRRAISEYIGHYHAEPNYQGLVNRLIRAEPNHVIDGGEIRQPLRLGGMLDDDHRAVA